MKLSINDLLKLIASGGIKEDALGRMYVSVPTSVRRNSRMLLSSKQVKFVNKIRGIKSQSTPADAGNVLSENNFDMWKPPDDAGVHVRDGILKLIGNGRQQELMGTSEQWYNHLYPDKDLVILSPDGWDRKHYDYSWNWEMITAREFYRRLSLSTVNHLPGKNIWNHAKLSEVWVGDYSREELRKGAVTSEINKLHMNTENKKEIPFEGNYWWGDEGNVVGPLKEELNKILSEVRVQQITIYGTDFNDGRQRRQVDITIDTETIIVGKNF